MRNTAFCNSLDVKRLRLLLCIVLQVVDKQEQTVGYVDIAHAAVEIEREQMQVGPELAYPLLYALDHDVIGNATNFF